MAISKKNGCLVPLAKEEDFDENFDKAEKKHPLIWLLRLTGLYFGKLKNGAFWYFLGMFRALLFCSLSIYQTGFMTYLLVMRKFDHKTPIYIFLYSWNIQATLSIIFIIYWQLKGHLSTLLSMVKWPPKNSKYKETRKSIRSVLIIFAVLLTFILINFYFVYYHMVTKNQKWLLLDLEFFDIYSSNYLKCLGAFVGIINANTSLVVLTFYIIVCHILNGEFMVFNKELMKVGSKGHQETVGDQLLHEYTIHIKMAKMVRLVDSTFEVYTFAMIGMNIPTTIFSLISCFTAVSTENLIIIVPAPLFCILQLFGLTSVPARVYTAIQQVRNILFSNMKIWKPFNEKTYQIASIFVSHVDQANLGISVWGFAVVTKPLILTIEQDSSKLSEQLFDKYIKHIQMARMVRTIDNTFEVYNFCMIGLNIPTTIFYIISLITSTNWENTIFILPAPIFCCFQLIGLTAIPARIHTAIQEVRNILYKNANIWKPYDGKTYQIASVFVSHIDHANLGISVWGFAIVTKPLILTTISLIITYLTILLQLQINKGGECSSGEAHNISGPTF